MRIYPLDGQKNNIAGVRVREARLRAGLSQEQLAAKLQLAGLQVTQMAVSRIEMGKRIVADYELPVLSKALCVTTDWLLGNKN